MLTIRTAMASMARATAWTISLMTPATVLLLATPAAATPFTVPPSEVRGDVGDVVLIGNDGRQLTSGDASTRFLVRLPAGATCPGDSANDQWRVSTFLIPVDEDPLDILFGSAGPEPPWTANRYPLFNTGENLPIVFNMLRKNPAPGSPGIVNSIPETSFTMLAENQFPGGHYRLGAACSYFAQTTQYWDTEIMLTDAPDGKDSQLTWTLPNAPQAAATATTENSESSSAPWIVIAAIGTAAVVAILIWRRRVMSSSRHTRSRDESVRQHL